jgi:hypothetical protein
MSRAAAPSRQPSSSRGGLLAHQECACHQRSRGARLIQPGSTWTELTMLRKATLAQPAGQRSAVGTPTLSLAVKDQGWW